jgi:probable F420-dependent oxidoreductase
VVRLGLYLRNMGPTSTRETIVECARLADEGGIDDLWVADHVAIPPDEAEGSNGRYLDPLATLAFLAGATRRVGLGTGVLILPYRPALPTAKWIATIQELSGGRFLLGVGSGWMESEFRALGVPKESRGRRTDATLDFLNRAFAADEIVENGQRFLFRPRPSRPPIFVGGSAEVAIPRAVRFGDGWMPNAGDADRLATDVRRLREVFAAAGKPAPEVVALTSLGLDDPQRAAMRARELAAAGATRIVHAQRYADGRDFGAIVETLNRIVRPALASA